MKPTLLVAFAVLLHGCGQAARPTDGSLSVSATYAQTLRAMMNLKFCEGLRGQSTSAAELRRSKELIGEAQRELKEVEAFARSKGLEPALKRGRIRFEQQVAEELWIVCYPDEPGASEQAHEAIERLRAHVAQVH